MFTKHYIWHVYFHKILDFVQKTLNKQTDKE